MSLPCVISKNGIDRVLELPLLSRQKSDLEAAYQHLRTGIAVTCIQKHESLGTASL